MKTKAEIVQRLLGEGKIDAEEAVVLLMGEEKQIQFVPYPYNPVPYHPLPYYPNTPIWVVGPNSQPSYQTFPTICQA